MDDANFMVDPLNSSTPFIKDTVISDLSTSTRSGIIPSNEEYRDMWYEEKDDADEHVNLDNYIGAKLLLDIGGEPISARVIKWAKNPDGTKKGTVHQNSMFDMRAFLVEMQDSTVSEYTANVIAENIFSQIDNEGNSHSIFQEISDHCKNNKAIEEWDVYVYSANRNKIPRGTTVG